jgi:hypothetical protein
LEKSISVYAVESLFEIDKAYDKWRLNINIKKTKAMILSKTERKAKTDSNTYLFDLNDNRLELVKEYKYLGLTVTCNGKFNYAAEIERPF